MTAAADQGFASRRSFIAAAGAAMVAGCATTSDNIKLYQAGSREPAIIFVHGLSCAGEDWKAQMDGLGSKYRCIAPDLPGHGSSPMAPGANSIAGLAAVINNVKKQSGARKVILVGHSMGGRVVLESYRTSPENIVGVSFVDSSIFSGSMDELTNRMRGQFTNPGYERLMRGFADEWFVGDRDADMKARLAARAQKLDKQLGQDLLLDIIRWDLTHGRDVMGRIAVPVQVIQSSSFNSQFKRVSMEDGMKTPFMDLAEKSTRNADVRIVKGVGHFPMLQAAATVNTMIDQFATRFA